MASGYTAQSATVGSFTVRFFWSSSYNASTNKSTITVMPRVYNTGNYGGDLWACGYNLSSPGIYLGGSRAYSFDAAWGTGYNLKCPANQNSWTSFPPYTGSISTITVSHNANGVASTTVRFLGTIVPTNFESYKKSLDSGNLTISFTEPAPYSITYNANGGSGAPSSQGVYAGVTYTLSNTVPTRTGYTFLGWSSNGSTVTHNPGDSVTPNGNLPLTAIWQINTYAVDYDANGGSGAPASQTKTYGQTLILAPDVPTRTGYTFEGWATTPDASVAQYQPGGNYTENQAATLYAVWQINQHSLSITKSEAGLVLNVTRTDSPIAGATTGILSDRAVIYHGDKLTVAYALSTGYAIDTATINGVDMSGTSEAVTVSGNVAVIVLVELQALAHIDNGASIDMYQIYIDDGNSFSAYQAYIDNGVSWDVY